MVCYYTLITALLEKSRKWIGLYLRYFLWFCLPFHVDKVNTDLWTTIIVVVRRGNRYIQQSSIQTVAGDSLTQIKLWLGQRNFIGTASSILSSILHIIIRYSIQYIDYRFLTYGHLDILAVLFGMDDHYFTKLARDAAPSLFTGQFKVYNTYIIRLHGYDVLSVVYQMKIGE